MQKKEFEELVEKAVTDEEYKVIEMVYQYHPVIKETSGKEEVVELFKSFGMTIFYDMLNRALLMCQLEEKRRKAKAELECIDAEIHDLIKGSKLVMTGQEFLDVDYTELIDNLKKKNEEKNYYTPPHFLGHRSEKDKMAILNILRSVST